MILRIVLWHVGDSPVSIEDLRRELGDAVEAVAETAGLRLNVWISDAAGERWGFVSLWESADEVEDLLPARASELIGKAPELAETFDVEATGEGRFLVEELSRRGLAFER